MPDLSCVLSKSSSFKQHYFRHMWFPYPALLCPYHKPQPGFPVQFPKELCQQCILLLMFDCLFCNYDAITCCVIIDAVCTSALSLAHLFHWVDFEALPGLWATWLVHTRLALGLMEMGPPWGHTRWVKGEYPYLWQSQNTVCENYKILFVRVTKHFCSVHKIIL